MSPNTLSFTCGAFHSDADHQIFGSIYIREEPTECQDYCSGDKAPHANSCMSEALNTHPEYFACQICYISSFASGQATKLTQFPPVDPTPEATEEITPTPTEEPAPIEE